MLVVKVELHSAISGKVTELGKMIIHNISMTGNASPRGDYEVLLFRKGSKKVIRKGNVYDYPRLSYSVWRLVLRALKSVLKEEQ